MRASYSVYDGSGEGNFHRRQLGRLGEFVLGRGSQLDAVRPERWGDDRDRDFSINVQDWLDGNGQALSASSRAGATFNIARVGQDVTLNYVAPVPEPSTYAMALAGLAYGGYSIWRRRKQA